MSSFRERNDRNTPNRSSSAGPRPGGGKPAPGTHRKYGGGDPDQWVWGWHAVEAALTNPDRPAPKRVLATAERAKQISQLVGADGRQLGIDLGVDIVENGDIAQQLPQGAVHQGVAIQTPALEPADLFSLAAEASGVLIMLDQVTDPQNVGAILRSAAAFGAKGVILQDRRAPPLAGALAKAAAGAMERIPCAQVINLSRALEELKEAGWRVIGMAGEATTALADALEGGPTVIVMGSEGEGLRRLVAEHCDVLARIPMPGGFESLNVASATAIALYAATQAG